MVKNVLDEFHFTNVNKLVFEYSSTELLYTELLYTELLYTEPNNIKINSNYLYLIQFI